MSGVPAAILIAPTLMITGRSASQVYSQPAAELGRLAKAGAVIRVARGYYAAVPVEKRGGRWSPSMESLTGGLATAVYGVGQGAIWGLTAARLHGALPRAIATGYALGPAQHRPIDLIARAGRVVFSRRDPDRLDLELVSTELGPVLATTIAQTILDLGARDFVDAHEPRAEAVSNLMSRVDVTELEELALRGRGATALTRARKLVGDAH